MKSKKINIKNLLSDRRWIFLFVLILLWVFVLYKTININLNFAERKLRVVISQQNKSIRTVYDEPSTVMTRDFLVDEINFPESFFFLKHKHVKTIGKYGFKKDFFVEIKAKIKILKDGEYEFVVSSDDGFALFLDDNLLMDYKFARPMSETNGKITLTAGEHKFRLLYFQAGGLMGLTAKYKYANDDRFYFVGHDSENVTFDISKD